MDQLERSVVQLTEAKRLAEFEDVPHGRLALLLLDNAAEVSLQRSAQTHLTRADWYGTMAANLLDADATPDAEGLRLLRQIVPMTISKRQRRQVERSFESLIDYVFAQERYDLPVEFGECLKILHRYRNAAYHRDDVQAEVLGPAVSILFFLCCHLLASEQQFFHEINLAPASVLAVFGDSPPQTTWPGPGGMGFDSSSLGRLAAERLLQDSALDHDGVARALSSHLIGRLARLKHDLDYIGEFIPPGVNRATTLRLVQFAPKDREEFNAEPPSDFWARPLPVTEATLGDWQAAALAIADTTDAVSALRAFADIEARLEELEQPVGRFLEDIDRMEDEASGR